MGISVYAISHKASGRFYVGQSRDTDKRFRNHKNGLRRGAHHCIHLQRAWNLYGEGEFEFHRLKSFNTVAEAIEAEQAILDRWFPTGALFNSDKSNDPKIGIRRAHTKEARTHMSATRINSPLLLAKLSEASKKSHTPEAEAKRIATLRRNGTACAGLRIPVRATKVANGEVLHFISLAEAARVTGASHGNVYSCCVGKRRKTKGYSFTYEWMLAEPEQVDPI